MRFIGGSSALPSSRDILCVLGLGLCSWVLVSVCFAILIYSIKGPTHISPFLIASAFAAGYIGGFISPLTPAGLGVREGIITAILGPGLGGEQVMAIALIFRTVHMAVIWIHVGFTALCMSYTASPSVKPIIQHK